MEAKRAHLIVGLGNPGTRYKTTRHNIGFMVVEALARKQGLEWKKDRQLEGKLAQWKRGEESTLLLMPETFMNESGIAVRKVVDYFGFTHSTILVVVDDVYIDFGEMRLREKGTSGGHKGLQSIELHLRTQGYHRLRLGVGANPKGIPLESYVLTSFPEEESEKLPGFIEEAVEVIEAWCEGGIKSASRKLSTKKKGEKSKDEKG